MNAIREHAGRARAAAGAMFIAALGPISLLVGGVIDSATNPWAAITVVVAAVATVVVSVPLLAIGIGILRRSAVARWVGIVIAALGAIAAVATGIGVNVVSSTPASSAVPISLWLALAAGASGFTAWALITARDYFGGGADSGKKGSTP